MRTQLVFAALCFALASRARAQGTASNQVTTAPPEAHFEILASELGVRNTFRLDRFTGQSAQLVLQADSSLDWQPIPKAPHPLPDTQLPGRANYQMFTSGLGARFTFLINVNTGATWQLQVDENGSLVWAPLYAK